MTEGQKTPIESESPKKAIGYIRVSTIRQKKKGTSIDTQTESIEKYAKEHNLEILELVTESRSASKVKNSANSILLTNRPKLQEILVKAQRKDITELIVFGRDRLTRNFSEFIILKDMFHRNGITIHLSNTSEKISPYDEAMEKFFDLMMSNVAMLEAARISERVKLGQQTNILNGYYVGGHTPFGYKLELDDLSKKKYYIKDISDAAVVEEIFNLYNLGFSYSEVIEEMRKRYPNLEKVKFSNSTISQIINNEIYTGILVWNRKSGNQLGNFDEVIRKAPRHDISIITPESFTNAQQIKNKQIGPNAKNYSTHFLLRGKLVCGSCNAHLKAKNNGKGKTNVYYCNCRYTNEDATKHWSLSIPQNLIENYVLNILYSYFNDMKDTSMLDECFKKYSEYEANKRAKISIILNDIEKEIKELDENIFKCTDILNNKVPLQQSNSKLYTDAFFEVIGATQTQRKIIKNFRISQKDELNKKLKTKVLTKEAFEKSFNDIISDFFKQNISTSNTDPKLRLKLIRIFIDRVIDKIIINQTPFGETLSIYIQIPNTPSDFNLQLQDTCPINYAKII